MSINSLTQNHSINNEIPSESIEKWDKDLDTIISLIDLVKNVGGDMVIKGGFATEAYTGGKQKRHHADIDITYYLPSEVKATQIKSKIRSLLNKESTVWKDHKSKYPKIEFREEDPSKDFPKRRRLEIYLRKEKDPAYETGEYQPKKLFNSKGKVVKVKVMALSELVAMKIHNIYMNENYEHKKGRKSIQTDYAHLKSLFGILEYDKDSTISSLAKMFKKKLSSENRIEKARMEYSFAKEFITSID